MPFDQSDLEAGVRLIGQKVRTRRVELGWSQESLAIRVEIDRKSLQNIEYGRASTRNPDGSYDVGNPKFDTLLRLANALEIDVAYLVDPKLPLRSSTLP